MKNIGQSARDLVVEYFEQGILSEQLKSGDKVMSERDLAIHLGVCRGAVREGVARLEGMGLVEFRRGMKGGTAIRHDGGHHLAHLFRLHLSLHGADKGDVIEVRIALERATAAFAANNHDDAFITELTEIVQAMEGEYDRAAYEVLDTKFHHAIANQGGNGLLFDLTRAIRTSVSDPIRKATNRIKDWDAYRTMLTNEHQGILDAIKTGNSQLASETMEAHIRHAWAILPHDLGKPEELRIPLGEIQQHPDNQQAA